MPERIPIIHRISAPEIRKLEEDTFPNLKVEVKDPYNQIYIRHQLPSMIFELVHNCFEQNASRVRIEVRQGKMIVEDDVEHSNANKLVERLNQERVRTTKLPDPELGFPISGSCGIFSTRKYLKEMGGKLTYHATEDNRVIAVATWLR